MRMFGPDGNPQARNLFAVISHLQRHARLTFHVTAQPHRGHATVTNVGGRQK